MLPKRTWEKLHEILFSSDEAKMVYNRIKGGHEAAKRHINQPGMKEMLEETKNHSRAGCISTLQAMAELVVLIPSADDGDLVCMTGLCNEMYRAQYGEYPDPALPIYTVAQIKGE